MSFKQRQRRRRRPQWSLAASIVLAVAMGSRSSWGLFVGPINSASGFGAAAVSLAVPLSALAWGLAQPVCGLLVRRVGAPRLLAAGGVLVAATDRTDTTGRERRRARAADGRGRVPPARRRAVRRC